MRSRRRLAALAVVPVLALVPGSGFAAGAISVANVGANAPFSLTLTSGTLTSPATNLNAADWSDTTGTTTGWNGTLAVEQFVYSSTWVAGASTALLSNATGTYTGAIHDANYKVTVTSDAGGTTLVVAYTGTQSGSGTATKGGAFTVGTHGLTITFKTATTYLSTDKYTIKADVLATSALTMAAGGTCTTANGALNKPTFVNTSTVVTSGTTLAVGAPLKILSDATNTGTGSWTCVPKATITVDTNLALAGTYTAMAQYTVVSGP